ncbi:unknown [Mycoplasma sp. CAG:776]|nr:unknown [Mycoplasma sp. CAG:776]
MQKPGCSKCAETTVQGRAYIDKKTGLLCVTLDEKYEKPEGLKVLVPFICTTCGTTEWKTIDTIEDKK